MHHLGDHCICSSFTLKTWGTICGPNHYLQVVRSKLCGEYWTHRSEHLLHYEVACQEVSWENDFRCSIRLERCSIRFDWLFFFEAFEVCPKLVVHYDSRTPSICHSLFGISTNLIIYLYIQSTNPHIFQDLLTSARTRRTFDIDQMCLYTCDIAHSFTTSVVQWGQRNGRRWNAICWIRSPRSRRPECIMCQYYCLHNARLTDEFSCGQ